MHHQERYKILKYNFRVEFTRFGYEKGNIENLKNKINELTKRALAIGIKEEHLNELLKSYKLDNIDNELKIENEVEIYGSALDLGSKLNDFIIETLEGDLEEKYPYHSKIKSEHFNNVCKFLMSCSYVDYSVMYIIK